MKLLITSVLLTLASTHPLGDYGTPTFSNPVSAGLGVFSRFSRYGDISDFGEATRFSGGRVLGGFSGIDALNGPGVPGRFGGIGSHGSVVGVGGTGGFIRDVDLLLGPGRPEASNGFARFEGLGATGVLNGIGGAIGFHGNVGGFDGPVGSSGVAGSGLGVGFGGGHGVGPCGVGEVRNVDGTCARPQVTRNFFVYDVPEHEEPTYPPPYIPDPKIDYNLIFIRTPENQGQSDPIVIPPPEQRTLVYVLNKDDENGKVIEVLPPPSQEPEVFFVNYQDGENPELPGGIDLHTAFGSAVVQNGGFSRGDVAGFEEAGVFGGAGGLGVAGGLVDTGSHRDAGGFAVGFGGSGRSPGLGRGGSFDSTSSIARDNSIDFASLGSSGIFGGPETFSDVGIFTGPVGSGGFAGSESLAVNGPGSFSGPDVAVVSVGSPDIPLPQSGLY